MQRDFKDFAFLSLLTNPETFSMGSITENANLTDSRRVVPLSDVKTSFTAAISFSNYSSGSPGVTGGSGLVDEGSVLLLPPSVLLTLMASLLLLLIEHPAARAADIRLIISTVMTLDSGAAGSSSLYSSARTFYPAPLT